MANKKKKNIATVYFLHRPPFPCLRLALKRLWEKVWAREGESLPMGVGFGLLLGLNPPNLLELVISCIWNYRNACLLYLFVYLFTYTCIDAGYEYMNREA